MREKASATLQGTLVQPLSFSNPWVIASLVESAQALDLDDAIVVNPLTKPAMAAAKV